MCRKAAWAELTVEVTFMVGIQSGMPEYKKEMRSVEVFQAFFTLLKKSGEK